MRTLFCFALFVALAAPLSASVVTDAPRTMVLLDEPDWQERPALVVPLPTLDDSGVGGGMFVWYNTNSYMDGLYITTDDRVPLDTDAICVFTEHQRVVGWAARVAPHVYKFPKLL